MIQPLSYLSLSFPFIDDTKVQHVLPLSTDTILHLLSSYFFYFLNKRNKNIAFN